MLRATQILPHTRYSDSESRTYASMGPHARHVMNFKLTGRPCIMSALEIIQLLVHLRV